MGGHMWVKRQADRGSTFHYTINSAVVAAGKAPAAPIETLPLAGIRTLIVDDNAASCRVLAEIVESGGIRPEMASDATQALSLLATAAHKQNAVPTDSAR
jgi:hypothetical protein